MKKFNTQHLLKAAILVLFLFTATIFSQETALQFNTDDANTKDEFIICTSGNYSPIFTIEAWVKLDSLITGDQTLLHSYHIQMKKNSDGYVEVAQVLAVFLGLDELLHVGMVDVQDSHVGAAAGPALFHHIGGGVKGANEADRAAGDTAGGADNVAFRPEPAEREPGAAPALVNQRGLLNLVEDRVQGVVNGQHETCR